MRRRYLLRGYIAVVLLGVAGEPRPGWAASRVVTSLKAVALSGQQVPGAPSGIYFSNFDPPVINNVGQTAFSARTLDVDDASSQRLGIWSEGSGELGLVALQGLQPPDASALEIVPSYAFNDRGETVFSSRGIWLHRHTSLEKIVGPGITTLIDGRPEVFERTSRPVINRNGVMAFVASRENFDDGIYVGADSQFTQIARHNALLPGTNRYPDITDASLPAINSKGAIAFREASYSHSSIWSNVRGSLEQVAEADYYRVTETRFIQLRTPMISNNNDVVFYGTFIGEEVTSDNDQGVILFDERGASVVAREDDHAPGLPDGFAFASFVNLGDTPRVLSDDFGGLAFRARLRGPGIDRLNEQSLWRVRSDELQLVVRAGTPAPGVEAGPTFLLFDALSFNRQGRVAFSAGLAGQGVYSTNDEGIWAEDSLGNLRLIVRDGDLVDLDPGPGADLRTIVEVNLVEAFHPFYEARGENDQPYAFNDRGQIAFQSQFTDGTHAILVSNLLLVPETETAVIAFLGIAFMAMTVRARYLSSWSLRVFARICG
jgi:hypothetical protein